MKGIRFLPSEEIPSALTSDYVTKHHIRMGIDPGIVDLVCALLDTGVVATTYSCEGHFNLQHGGAFCHHNQKAQVHFHVKNLALATALCHEILTAVVFDGLAVSVVVAQNKGAPDDELEIVWCLEYRPEGFWEMWPQDAGMYIGIAPGWSEQKVRKLLQKAFKATIKVCRKGQWRNVK